MDEELEAVEGDLDALEDDEQPTVQGSVDSSDSVPFFRNWVFWMSLVAAIPAAFLCGAIVLDSIDHAGGSFNWLMYAASFFTFLGSLGATTLPLLIALGFFMGGKEMAAPVQATLPEGKKDREDGFAEDDDDAFDDESGEFDTDDDIDFADDEDEDDDFDF